MQLTVKDERMPHLTFLVDYLTCVAKIKASMLTHRGQFNLSNRLIVRIATQTPQPASASAGSLSASLTIRACTMAKISSMSLIQRASACL